MKHVALFSGMGGFIKAADNLNFDTCWANEVDNDCCDVLRLNFPKTTISQCSIEDVTSEELSTIPCEIDLLTAGFPCQSFSTASAGATGFEDARGKLFFEIPRLISKMKAPPKVVLLENVPNIKIFDHGAWLKVILNEMRFAGYWVKENHAAILSAAEVAGSPQTRERLFIVCCHKNYFKSNPFRFSAIKPKKTPNVFEIIDTINKQDDEYYLPEDSKYFSMINNVADKVQPKRLYQIRRVFARACAEGICPTLTANMGDGGHNVPFVFDKFGLRRLTEEECLKMQGFNPESFLWPSDLTKKAQLKMIGNAVNVDMVEKIISEIKFQLLSGQTPDDRNKFNKVALPA
jgi:DNA (cytosine-5)-methyltransferase 1